MSQLTKLRRAKHEDKENKFIFLLIFLHNDIDLMDRDTVLSQSFIN